MKKIKCKLCKTKFVPKKENMYLAQDLSNLLASKEHECFDCPQCGRQNVVNIRIKRSDKL